MKIHTIKISKNTNKKFNILYKRHGSTRFVHDFALNKSTILFAPNGAGKTTLFRSMTKDFKYSNNVKDPVKHALNARRIYEGGEENFFSPFQILSMPSDNASKNFKKIYKEYTNMGVYKDGEVNEVITYMDVDNSKLFMAMYKSNLSCKTIKEFLDYEGNTNNLTEIFNSLPQIINIENLHKVKGPTVNLGFSPKLNQKLFKYELKLLESMSEEYFNKYLEALMINDYKYLAMISPKKVFKMTFMSTIFDNFNYGFNYMIRESLVNHLEAKKDLNKEAYTKFLKVVYRKLNEAVESTFYWFGNEERTIKRQFTIVKPNFDDIFKKTEDILINKFNIATKINNKTFKDKNLSYGQQRVVDLILGTQIHMNTQSNLAIIDDPSTGMSENHKFLIAEYLVGIAKEKKFWIFTHDVSFLKQLKCLDKRDETFDVDTLFQSKGGRRIIERVTPYAPLLFNFTPERIKELWEILKSKNNINIIILSLLPAMYRSQLEFANIFLESKDIWKLYKTTSDVLHNREKLNKSISKMGVKRSVHMPISELMGTPFDDVLSAVGSLASMNAGRFGIFDPNFESYYLMQHFFKLSVVILFRGIVKESVRFLPSGNGIKFSDEESDRTMLKKIKKIDEGTWKKIATLRNKYSNRLNNLVHYSGFTGDLIHDYDMEIFTNIYDDIMDIRDPLLKFRMGKAKVHK